MTDELRKRASRYRSAVSVVKEMQKKNLVSKDDLQIINTILLEYFGLSSKSVFRDTT